MKIAIHQPNYLPWIGFIDKLDQVDKFVILDRAIHTKSGYINRTKIKSPQGSLMLTVPLKNKEVPINELLIANDINWQTSHWRAIEANYKKSKYWNAYKEGFEQLYIRKWENIAQFNIAIIKHIMSQLNITTELYIESEFALDFGTSNERNVNIVTHLGGDHYISGIGGRVYNDETIYHHNNIILTYQNFQHPKYSQRWGNFEPNLSIIDMLFNCGLDTIEIIRENRMEYGN